MWGRRPVPGTRLAPLAGMNRLVELADGPEELVPDQLLPVQFFELLQRPPERSPELRLMAAVLEDAVRRFCVCAGAAGTRRRREFEETADWFQSTDTSWPFSFENICQALGLAPAWIRRMLDRWHAAHTLAARWPVKIACIRRMAGTRHAVTGRAPGLRQSVAC